MENVKQPSEAGMMCTIDVDTFYLFTKNTWIGDSGVPCHITDNYTGLYDLIDIDEFIQGSSSIISTAKKGKLWVKVHQVNRTEWVCTLWRMKFCPKAGANLFSLTCKLLQGKRIASDHCNNIVVNTLNGNVILDCQIKTHDGWDVGVDFLCDAHDERAVSATALPRRISSTFMLNLVIHPRSSLKPLLKPLVSKSLVPSNHVKIAPWVRPSNVLSTKRLYHVRKFWGKGFSLT